MATKTKKITEKLQVINVNIEKPFSAKEVFEQLKQEILNGHTDIFKAYLFLHQVNSILEMFKKDNQLKNALENIVMQFDDTPVFGFNAKLISKKTFDFSVCNDATLNTIIDEMNALKIAKDKRETYLKVADDFPAPAIKYTTYIEVKKAA